MIKATAHAYRNAYSGLSRSTWLLSVIMLINRSGTMVIPFMTIYLTSSKMGYSISQAGLVFGLFGAGAFSGAWIGGRLTDRIGFYPIQMITLIGGGILFIVLGQMHSFFLISLFTFLVGFVNEAFRPANSTAIAHYSNEENRTRSYAINRLAINIGWALGSGIGGFIAKYNYELLFWIDGFTNMAAAAIMWIYIKPINHKAHQKELAHIPKAVSAYRDKTYISFILITTLFASCFFQFFTNLPVYFKKELHLSTPYIGGLMAMNGLIIAMVEMVMIYKLEGKRKNLHYISAGVALVGISFISLNIPANGVYVALAMMIGATFGEIFSMPFMNSYWIARTQPTNRGQYAALYTMAWSAAQTLGPIGGSQIAQHFGFIPLWFVVGGLCLSAAFFFSRLR